MMTTHDEGGFSDWYYPFPPPGNDESISMAVMDGSGALFRELPAKEFSVIAGCLCEEFTAANCNASFVNPGDDSDDSWGFWDVRTFFLLALLGGFCIVGCLFLIILQCFRLICCSNKKKPIQQQQSLEMADEEDGHIDVEVPRGAASGTFLQVQGHSGPVHVMIPKSAVPGGSFRIPRPT